MIELPGNQEAWSRVCIDTYRLNEHRFEKNDSRLVLFETGSFIGKPAVSTAPYLTDGGLVNKENEVLDECVEFIRQTFDQVGSNYLLIKTRDNLFEHIDGFVVDKDFYTFVLDLKDGVEAIWQEKLNQKTRNQTRKSQKYDFEARFGWQELLDDFYGVISRAWRDLGTPTHARRFYQNILHHLGEQAELIVIYQGREAISAALMLKIGKTIHHPYAATLKQYNRFSANNFLYWEIIKHACGEGFEWFDMGRSHKDQGTVRYKKSWGAEPVQLFYNYYIRDVNDVPNFHSSFVQFATTMWKKLPLFVANRVGPYLIRGVM